MSATSDNDYTNVLANIKFALAQEPMEVSVSFRLHKVNGKIKIVDVFQIFCKLFPRNLTFAYKFFCGKELEGAHGAAADTQATMEVLFSQLEKYEEVPKELTALAEYSNPEGADKLDRARRFRWLNDEVIISFGKHHGTTLKEVASTQPSFLTWMLNSDFDEDTKKIAYDALHGKFPERKNPTAGSAK